MNAFPPPGGAEAVERLWADLRFAVSASNDRSSTFLLEHARPWVPGPRPDDVGLGRPKRCFANAGDLAFAECDEAQYKGRAPRWLYCEGVAGLAGASGSVRHAWLCTAGGEAIEVTTRAPFAAYLGVACELSALRRVVATGAWQPVITLDDQDPAIEMLRSWPNGPELPEPIAVVR